MYGQHSKAVYNQERVMMVHVRQFNLIQNTCTHSCRQSNLEQSYNQANKYICPDDNIHCHCSHHQNNILFYLISNDFQYFLIFFDTHLKLEFEPTKACAVSAKILQHFEPTTISTIKVAHLIVVDIITKCISNPIDYPMIVCNLQKTKVDTWTILFLINGCI